MNCKKFRRELPAYLYGEISEKERESFGGHAETCPACRRLLEELEETVSRLADAPGPEFPPGELTALRGRVRERVRRAARGFEPVRRRPGVLSHPLFLPGALAAALAVFSEKVEAEFQEFAEIWEEIEEIEALFPPDPAAGAEADNRNRELAGRSIRGLNPG